MKSSSKINGTIHFLWRAVDQHGNVLDVLVQSRRHAVAAIKFVRPLLTARRYVPRVLVTDKLASDGPAHRLLMPAVEHRQSKYQNNRAENAHQHRRQVQCAATDLTRPDTAESPRISTVSAGYVRRTVFGAQGKPNRSGNAQG